MSEIRDEHRECPEIQKQSVYFKETDGKIVSQSKEVEKVPLNSGQSKTIEGTCIEANNPYAINPQVKESSMNQSNFSSNAKLNTNPYSMTVEDEKIISMPNNPYEIIDEISVDKENPKHRRMMKDKKKVERSFMKERPNEDSGGSCKGCAVL